MSSSCSALTLIWSIYIASVSFVFVPHAWSACPFKTSAFWRRTLVLLAQDLTGEEAATTWVLQHHCISWGERHSEPNGVVAVEVCSNGPCTAAAAWKTDPQILALASHRLRSTWVFEVLKKQRLLQVVRGPWRCLVHHLTESTSSYNSLLSALFSWVLSNSKDEDSPTSLGSSFGYPQWIFFPLYIVHIFHVPTCVDCVSSHYSALPRRVRLRPPLR